MARDRQKPLAGHRFQWAEIVLSTLAILGLAALLFIDMIFLTWVLATAFTSLQAMEALREAMADRANLRTDANVQTMSQIIEILFYVAIGLSIWVIWRTSRRMPLAERVAFVDWHSDRIFYIVLAGALAYSVVADLWLTWFHPASRDWLILPNHPLPLFLAFVGLVAVAPVVEEVLFRGWIFTALRSRMGFAPALSITSVVFALAHFESTLLYAFVVFPVGVAMGYLRERYGSSKASALFHCSYNLFGLCVTLLGMV